MNKDRDDLLNARRQAGSPDGIAYADRLAAMPPEEAAAKIDGMFALCAWEDLAGEIAGDLQLPHEAAEKIADAIIRRHAGAIRIK
jgi:hypothetical protein